MMVHNGGPRGGGRFLLGISLLPGGQSPQALHDEGRRILALLAQTGGVPGAIVLEPSGRPRFACGCADFSISHSRSMAAVSFLAPEKGWPGALPRTGCDIQELVPPRRWSGICAHYFAPEEQDYVLAGEGHEEQAMRFCHIWTLKEAFLKARGLSIAAFKEAPVFSPEDWQGGGGLSFFLYEIAAPDSRYALAVAAELPSGRDSEPELRWFSGERPDIRRIS